MYETRFALLNRLPQLRLNRGDNSVAITGRIHNVSWSLVALIITIFNDKVIGVVDLSALNETIVRPLSHLPKTKYVSHSLVVLIGFLRVVREGGLRIVPEALGSGFVTFELLEKMIPVFGNEVRELKNAGWFASGVEMSPQS